MEGDLLTGLGLLSDVGASGPIGAAASLLLRAVRQESHTLRGWDVGRNPALFRKQWLKRALLLGEARWADHARSFLKQLPCSHLEVTWTSAQSDKSLVRTLSGHSSWVNAVAVTPDGRQAVSGAGDNTLRVWDLTSGETVRTLSDHSEGVWAVAVTPDGRQAVSGSWDKTLRVWDLPAGLETARLVVDAAVYSIAAAPDGRTLVAGDASGNLWCLQYRDRSG